MSSILAIDQTFASVQLADRTDFMTLLAECYIKEKFPFRERKPLGLRVQEHFLSRVAITYEMTPHAPDDPNVRDAYDALKEEILMQFEFMSRHDIRVRPFLGQGQPYANSADMMARVASTSTLYVYLTSRGYGSDASAPADHPMLELSDIVIDGCRFTYNDLFRAVHDYYCHYSPRQDFSLQGECMAALHHLELLSSTAGRAVFTETVGQICWFYRGAHLLDRTLRLPTRIDSDYTPPRSRRYPPQKAMLLPACLIERFRESVVEPWIGQPA
ncbi:crotonobetainyl-CoA--carnitine CoA-transferase [Paraburkholderia phenazinium]|nr:crotonobetainyl-CoA--carnitine CoA-transferase [Paraburkholderia phenazinium]